MAPLFSRVRSQFACPASFSNAVFLCLLLGALCVASSAQTVTGLPQVGNGTATPSSSQMLIDATQFNGLDMCAKIIAACGQLGATNYPLGATIDARGFTGNQVCGAGNITTMLDKCVPRGSSHATGGKLLLGEVNLYADGPSSGTYTYGTGSGPGTPALVIPNEFWGIEGVSRGSVPNGSSPGVGTFLSVCTGSGTPVSACTTAFPQRTFSISSIGVSGTNPTTMTITISGAVTAYVGELAMVKVAGPPLRFWF